METKKHEHLTPETDAEFLGEKITTFWRSIESDVHAALQEHINRVYHRWGDDERTEKFQEAMIHEESFVREILSHIEKITGDSSSGQGRVLFDIDDTLGKIQFDENGEKITGFLFRPSAIPLMDYLKDNYPKVVIGLLTTRGQEAVVRQLGDSLSLGPIQPYVNEAEVYGVGGRQDLRLMGVEGEFEYLKNHPMIDPAKLSPENFYGLTQGELRKLEVLKEVYERDPDMLTLVIDDQQFPKYLNNGIVLRPFG